MEKIVGWILILAGIVLIIWTLYSSYNIFTGKVEIPEVFKIEQKEKTQEPTNGETQEIQAQLEEMIGEKLTGLIPADTFPNLLNLIVWLMLAFVLIFGGTQIASLGIKLTNR